MTDFRLSVAGAADLDGIAAFLDDHAPHATEAVLDGLLEAMRKLAARPALGHLREDLTTEPVRFYRVWSYLVVDRVADHVEVVRVLHAARDVADELGRPHDQPT